MRLSSVMAYIIVLFSSCSYSSRATKRMFNAAKGNTYDAIIVPGIQFDNNKWDRVMKARVYWSKYLLDQGITKKIIYSGSAVYTPYTEARIMSMYAQAIGVPEDKILLETKAEHSTENVYYSYQLAKKLGLKKIAVASDPFQTKMVKRFTRKRVSRDVDFIPFVIDTLKMIEPSMTDPTIDSEKAMVKDFVSIRKREGFWKRLRGTLGKSIDSSNTK